MKVSRRNLWGFLKAPLDDLLQPPSSQIPFLDALRTAAVLLVISNHFIEDYASQFGQNLFSRLIFVRNGWAGVDLFFVLSGFFIGGQLWKELNRSGGVHIGRFILRRGLRIWPLYLFVFLCILLWRGSAAAVSHYGWSDLAFLTNYFNRGIVLGSWSLCTEEQFYILAPVLLAVFAVKNVFSFQKWLWVLLSVPLLFRMAVWIHSTGALSQSSQRAYSWVFCKFHTHCEGLIMGLIISNLWVSGRRGSKWMAFATVPAGVAVLVLCQHLQPQLLVFTGLAFFFGSLTWFGLHWSMAIFESRLFYWGSRLSFGMYLNHPHLAPFVSQRLLPHMPGSATLRELVGFAIVTILSASVSLITFALVEHPFLWWRSRLLERQSVSAKAPLNHDQTAIEAPRAATG